MKKINIHKEYLKLSKAQSKYESSIGDLEGKIKDKIPFDFSIVWQPSDGFVILHYDSSQNAPLFHCLKVIDEKGILTEEDYMDLCI